jgi:FixJ family two-component response regulator
MASTLKPGGGKSAAARNRPRVLVVDDEPDVLHLLRDVAGREIPCDIRVARDVDEAKRMLEAEPVELLVTDLHLPDGDGMALLSSLRAKLPTAHAIVITGQPSVNNAISALRAGVVDFLPKPFSAAHFVERVNKALERQRLAAKTEKRLDRLRDAVRRLNVSRRMVTKKVDLLCNDLVSAYGELSRQFDDVRFQENFRHTLEQAADLEQLLCHAMDWLLKRTGYCNMAVWLASEAEGYQLGAYMKYTIPGEAPITEAMRNGLVPLVGKEQFIHLKGADVKRSLSPGELEHLKDQTILAVNCTYLGEGLAQVILFRDTKSPFTDDDAVMLKAVSPIFATALAGVVRRGEDEEDDSHGGNGGVMDDDGPKNRPRGNGKDGGNNRSGGNNSGSSRDKSGDADWWKRGEAPPF